MASTGIIAGLAGDGGDPRLSTTDEREKAVEPPIYNSPSNDVGRVIKPQQRHLHDINVKLEEYMYYAEFSRAEEDHDALTGAKTTIKDVIFPSLGGGARQVRADGTVDEKSHTATDVNLSRADKRAAVSDEEWANASRALRSATAAACFYLITTDILGPFGIGFAIGTMGWGEGIGLFTLFGLCAGM